jgi:branched-chain amino acid transport system ATP-binding protein
VPLLELENVGARYGAVQALHGVSLSVGEREVVAVLGGNGAGKTTTLRAVSGLVSTSGQVRFGGQRITGASPERVARAGIAHVPEGRGLFNELSVYDNLRLGAYLQRDGFDRRLRACPGALPLARTAARPAGGNALPAASSRCSPSRGARWAGRRLLLLDEPSLGLAPLIVREIFRILGDLNEEGGLAVLVVEQNAKLALRSSSRAYVLEVGRVALEGPSPELAENESVRRRIWGIDRVPATGRRWARVGIDLRAARTRDRDHLSLDRDRELRPGRDGDVHDLHRVDAGRPRRQLLGCVRADARDRVRGRDRARADDRAPRSRAAR